MTTAICYVIATVELFADTAPCAGIVTETTFWIPEVNWEDQRAHLSLTGQMSEKQQGLISYNLQESPHTCFS